MNLILQLLTLLLQETRNLFVDWKNEPLVKTLKRECVIWMVLILETLTVKAVIALDKLLALGFVDDAFIDYLHGVTKAGFKVVFLMNVVELCFKAIFR